MKMNKKRLAALAMSAVMAASTMSYSVYAEELITEETPVTEAQVEQATSSVAYRVDPTTIVFNPDFSVTWTEVAEDGSNVSYTESGTASVLKETAADCENPAYLWMTITIDGKVYNSGNTDDPTTAFVTAPALGHEDEEVRRQTIEEATHTQDGLAHVWYECSRCGRTYDTDVTLDAQEHVWEDFDSYEAVSNILVDANGVPVLGEDGLPQLDDITRDGYYDVVRYCVNHDGATNVIERDVLILAKKASYAVITAQSGIASQLVGRSFDSPTTDLPLDNDSIELTNCTKDGYYIVTYYQNDGKPISEEKIPVTAHHMETKVTVEFKTVDDAKQCTVTYSADGSSYTIRNKSCYLPITYYEVIHCTAAGCPNDKCKTSDALVAANPQVGHAGLTVVSKTEKVAEPAGDHVINTAAKKAIEQAVANGVTYEDLEAIAKQYGYVKVSNDTSTCTEDGTATVEYLCKVCGTVVKTVTVDVVKKGHIVLPPTGENYVAPTCTSTGRYDAVTYCDRCGEVIREVRDVIIPRIRHTNEISVTTSGVGTDDTTTDTNAYIKFFGNKVVDYDGESLKNIGTTFNQWYYGGYPKSEYAVWTGLYTNCEICHDHEVLLDNYTSTKITVVDCQKQKESGEAGYITLKATYTKADGSEVSEVYSKIPYFSTMEAYLGRVENIPLNGLNKDEDGVYRYYENGEFVSDFSGIVEYAGESFFVANGVLASEANGLNEYEGKWYFLSQGQIQRAYTGLAEYDGQWFYIVNGKLDTNINGLVPYNGGMFLFAEGRLCKEANGLWQDFDGTWYFLALGQVQTQHTGVAEYDGAFFYVRNGKLATDYNGTITYDGAKFNVVAGQLYGPIA